MLTGPAAAPSSTAAAERVVRYVWQRVKGGDLKPGARLPPERELARQLEISRPSVRAGIGTLAAMGLIHSRQGSGSFVTDGPPSLVPEQLRLLAALHGINRDALFESRLVLEVATAGLAAERADGEQLAALADEVTGMFASLADPSAFLLHDVSFHRAVGLAANNPVLGALTEMVASLFYDQRKGTIRRATDLRLSAEQHRRIYQAIRARRLEAAREAMRLHLQGALSALLSEDEPKDKDRKAKGARK
jgi:GntR family transcriptional regulator, transcriptional repressor for pyruvate dehydrogenase complex